MSTRLDNEFTVPVSMEDAWQTLLDVERIAPCMPGATLESVDGETVTGRVRVKVGPVTVTYRGTATFVETDAATHTVLLDARGKEARGTGTAQATVRATLYPAEDGAGGDTDSTRVAVATDLNVTGRAAQFGRGVIADVSAKLVDRFAHNLATEISEGGAKATATAGNGQGPGQTEAATSSVPSQRQSDAARGSAKRASQPYSVTAPSERGAETEPEEPSTLNILDLATGPVLRRMLPVAGVALVATLLIGWLLRRRRRR